VVSAGAGRPYAGKLPGDRRQERRQRLIEAGLELFGTRGFAATTIVELCRAASVAPAKFYEEFDGREAVLVAVAEEVGDAATAAVLAALRDTAPVFGGDLRRSARAGLAAFCHSLLEDPRRARVFVLEVVGVSRQVEVRRRAVLDGFSSLVWNTFRIFISASERPATDRERIVANALVGGTNEAISAWLHEEEPPAVGELIESLAGMFAAVAAWLAGEDGAGIERER
jgi:AcrR family transcriptional regulator